MTKRLATCYACLCETDTRRREQAFRDFKEIYRYRSDLLHGRGFTYDNSGRNLEKLARVEAAVRLSWQRVLADPQIQAALEEDDTSRKAYFDRLCQGYAPDEVTV